jgi:hypothetical protein
MARWKVSTKEKKSVEEREIWTHPRKGMIERKTGFRWGSYIVTTEDSSPPQFELVEVPGGDGAADSIDMNSCGYDTELIGLEDGCYLNIAWPTSLNSSARDHLESVWAEDSSDGWENLGWMLDDTQVWIWGDLEIELLDEGNAKSEEVISSPTSTKEEGLTEWFPANIKPIRDGYYDIELVVPRAWPFMPLHRAKWNGRAWLDDAGEKVKIKRWRGLLKS